jgi:hypothetical protein
MNLADRERSPIEADLPAARRLRGIAELVSRADGIVA